MSGKKVAVIGAGSSGCCAAKNALENGLEPTIFEKAQLPGGLWASCNDNRTAVWDGLYANISYFCMQFSDHPHTYGPSIIPSFKDISAYILSYIEKFKLDKCMRLSTQVNKVKYLPDKRWEVNSLNLITNESKTEIFDFLIVSSGLHASPRIPKFENMENFSGLMLHGSQFKLNDERLKGKRVVVLGHSYSATDISANCVGTASTVTNLFRRPYLVTPRLIRFKSEINKNKKNSFHVVPIDFLIFRRVSTLCEAQTPEGIKEFNRKHLMQINVEQSNKELSHPDLYYDFDEDEIRESISDNYYAFVKKGEVKPKKGHIKRFESDSIILEDGSVEKADVVIFCTGFDVNITFFEKEVLDLLEYDKKDYKFPYLLYKCTFHPELENMAMICQNDGLFFTCTELQSKWASMVFTGKKALPDKAIMKNEISSIRERRKADLKFQYPYAHNQLMDMLATELGVLPNFEEIKEKDPKLYDMIWNNTAISSIFLLNTDKREAAMKLIEEVDYLTKKEYIFDDNDENLLPSVTELGEKLAQSGLKVPFHIFKT